MKSPLIKNIISQIHDPKTKTLTLDMRKITDVDRKVILLELKLCGFVPIKMHPNGAEIYKR